MWVPELRAAGQGRWLGEDEGETWGWVSAAKMLPREGGVWSGNLDLIALRQRGVSLRGRW